MRSSLLLKFGSALELKDEKQTLVKISHSHFEIIEVRLL